MPQKATRCEIFKLMAIKKKLKSCVRVIAPLQHLRTEKKGDPTDETWHKYGNFKSIFKRRFKLNSWGKYK